MLFNLGT